MIRTMLAGAALLALAAPLAAQQTARTSPATQAGSQNDPGTPRAPLPQDRGYDKPQVRTEAINAPNRDDVARANNMSSGSAVTAITTNNGDLQAQYASDMASWVEQMRARDARIVANAQTYDRQQRAYADAMYVYRMQVRDCERGVRFACNRPIPNPADYVR